MALDVSKSSSDNRKCLLWQQHGEENQRFRLFAKNGKYVIMSRHGNQVLQVCSNIDGEKVRANERLNAPGEFWEIVPVEGQPKTYYIKSFCGKYLDAEGTSTSSGTNIIQWHYNGGANQMWIIEEFSSVPQKKKEDGESFWSSAGKVTMAFLEGMAQHYQENNKAEQQKQKKQKLKQQQAQQQAQEHEWQMQQWRQQQQQKNQVQQQQQWQQQQKNQVQQQQQWQQQNWQKLQQQQQKQKQLQQQQAQQLQLYQLQQLQHQQLKQKEMQLKQQQMRLQRPNQLERLKQDGGMKKQFVIVPAGDKSLALDTSLGEDRGKLVIWHRNNKKLNQRWEIRQVGESMLFYSKMGGVMRVRNSENGTRVTTWDRTYDVYENWTLQPVKGTKDRCYILSFNGKALDADGGKMLPTTQVIQWDFHGGINQQWCIEEV